MIYLEPDLARERAGVVSDASQGPGWWLASDGKWYPPQPPAPRRRATEPAPAEPAPAVAYGPAPPPTGAYAGPIGPPPTSGMNGCLKWGLIVGGIVAVFGHRQLRLRGRHASTTSSTTSTSTTPRSSTTSTSKGVGATSSGFLRADLEVTNDSSERSNYLVTVTFEDGDGDQIDTGVANVVAAGAAPVDHGDGFSPPPTFTGDFDCRVVGVERFSDEG